VSLANTNRNIISVEAWLAARWLTSAIEPLLCLSGLCHPPAAGGTRFIGVYLARMLIDAGHEVTLLTRGKKPVTYRIPDDTGATLCTLAYLPAG
jgi:hypothetical protein